jgi:hypothetical protein
MNDRCPFHSSARLLLGACAVAALAACAAPAAATGALLDVRIVDRSTGETLPNLRHDGQWWVAGQPGSRYAVRLTNRTGGRLLAVLSVDGVNAVTGETAKPDGSGYVLAPGASAEITGWRKDLTRVAAFEFTALASSYAALTGRPDNVGVIGVAVFRERAAPVPPIAQRDAHDESARAAAPAAAANEATADARGRAESTAPLKLGTGHGRQERSVTRYTDFERAQEAPDELIAVRYESRDALVALGVLPRPRPLPNPRPNPFPAAAGFVPDPR